MTEPWRKGGGGGEATPAAGPLSQLNRQCLESTGHFAKSGGCSWVWLQRPVHPLRWPASRSEGAPGSGDRGGEGMKETVAVGRPTA